jgi:hypothetical protein
MHKNKCNQTVMERMHTSTIGKVWGDCFFE